MLLLTFTSGANRYAVDVARVVELVPKVLLRPVPHAPPFVAGLIRYRGKVVPVIDLGVLLGGAPCRDCLSTRIILVNDTPGDHNRWKPARDSSHEDSLGATAGNAAASDLLGLVAEQVTDLTTAHPDQIAPAPVPLPNAPYLDSIVRSDQGIIQLIAVDKVRQATLGSPSIGPARVLNPAADAGRVDRVNSEPES